MARIIDKLNWVRKLGGAMALALSALFLPLPLYAESEPVDYHWKPVVVGGGGFSPGIIFSRAERGLAYLRTDIGGLYRFDARLDEWVPTQDQLADGNLHGIESVAADPVNPDVVHVAAGMYRNEPAAMLRSDNRGASWRVTPVPFRMGGNEPGRGLGERLAIDPNDTDTLYFGSRYDGLWRSRDGGASWQSATTFPHRGLTPPEKLWESNAGVGFVLIDPTSGSRGSGSRVIYASVADKGYQGILVSRDAGESWQRVADQPSDPQLIPVRAVLAKTGDLFVTYADSMGPNGVTRGSVWRLSNGEWTDISPVPTTERHVGGYMAIDLSAPGDDVLTVATMNWSAPHDTLWVSTDRGATWRDIGADSIRDISASPFLRFDGQSADIGHWMAGLAIDPFDPSRMAYTTGATVYAASDWQSGRWTTWTKGIEETAILALASPGAGAPLVSGFGDIAGFVHDDLSKSPSAMHLNPHLVTTLSLDYAGTAPSVMVRSGRRHEGWVTEATLALSHNGGRTWRPILLPPYAELGETTARRQDLSLFPPVAISADGMTIAVGTPTPLFSSDGGVAWISAKGGPRYGRPFADKLAPGTFYMLDPVAKQIFVTRDGGKSARRGAQLPTDIWLPEGRPESRPLTAAASPFRAGEFWIVVGGRLFHSVNFGRRLTATAIGIEVKAVAVGKSVSDSRDPVLFVFGKRGGTLALWRSLDGGKSFDRINDAEHQWGNRITVLSGDPRVFGRIYVGTDGRGAFWGDPAERNERQDQ